MVDQRFGRCKYFIFYDLEKNEYEAVQNPYIDDMGGVGIQSGQLIFEKNAKVILTGRVGPNAFKTLNKAGVEIITDVCGTVKEIIEKYKERKSKPTYKLNV